MRQRTPFFGASKLGHSLKRLKCGLTQPLIIATEKKTKHGESVSGNLPLSKSCHFLEVERSIFTIIHLDNDISARLCLSWDIYQH